MTQHLTKKQVKTFERKDFWGEDVWKAWNLNFEECLRFRKQYAKTMKGKPDEYDRLILDLNDMAIQFYNHALYGETPQ